MTAEGWHNDDYLILFDDAMAGQLASAYGLADALPEYRLIGLRGWDDFVVADKSGATFAVPTVPLDRKHLAPYVVPPIHALKSDSRFIGKVKWYLTPIAFGGSAGLGENMCWISLAEHAQLVQWWNAKFREVSTD